MRKLRTIVRKFPGGREALEAMSNILLGDYRSVSEDALDQELEEYQDCPCPDPWDLGYEPDDLEDWISGELECFGDTEVVRLMHLGDVLRKVGYS